MRRPPRKRHVQLELADIRRHGGRRRGAGRKRVADRPGVPHRRRPAIDPRHPQHVTLRVLDCVGRLRRREAYRAVREALRLLWNRSDFRIVHLSIQRTHLHLICEADSREAFTSGMTAFKGSCAKRLNKHLGRKGGRVWADRYHARPLTSVASVRNGVAYCLNNWRHHGDDRNATFPVDIYSSAIAFLWWQEGPAEPLRFPDGYRVLPVAEPRTWLLKIGLVRDGRPISWYETPGGGATTAAAATG